MKYLQILNAVVLALGAAMGVILSVVCLLYLLHLGDAPRLRADLPPVMAATGIFLALGAAGALALFGHRRGWAMRWLLQALPVVPVGFLAWFLASLRA